MQKKTKRTRIYVVLIGLLIIIGIGGIVYKMKIPTEHEKPVAFLKAHEKEMTEYIKSQKFYITTENEKEHPVVKKVVFDYGDFDTYRRDAGGIPYKYYTIDITGYYNDSIKFELLIDVDSLSNPKKILNFERY